MKILIKNGRVIDPASGHDAIGEVAVAAGRLVAVGRSLSDFTPNKVIDAQGCLVLPGLVDLAVRLREPGHEHERMLESELAAAVAGGVTSLVCPPDTDPVLDEPGLVEMLRFRAERLHQARVLPLGALTRGLAGEVLTEMAELSEAGCVGFSQAEVALTNTQVLLRAMQYAATFGYTVWLRPQDAWLGKGVAASGPLATRLGLAGVPVIAETIALHTIFELMRGCGARVHICRLSSAQGVELVRQARAEGLPVTSDVSIHSLHLTDADIGYFDSRARLNPPLRQQRDRTALRAALADGTIDALVSDHTPVDENAKTLPFAEAEPGATGIELLLGLALKWSAADNVPLPRALATLTSGPAAVLARGQGAQPGCGQLLEGAAADLCLVDPAASWMVDPAALRSKGRHTPFAGHELPARVRWTIVGGQIAFEAYMRQLTGLVRLVRLLLHILHGLWTIRRHFAGFSPAGREQAIQAWASRMLRLAGVELTVSGCAPQPGPVLLVANHISWLDIPLLMAAVHCRFVSKADVRHWPVVGFLADACGTLYIERESRRDAMRVVHHMAESLRSGATLAVFPEGTTSDGRALLPFHANLFQAAIAADVPVQPLALSFVDRASGRLSLAPAYVGEDSLLGSVWRTITAPPLQARLVLGPAAPAQGRDRRSWARDLQAEISSLRSETGPAQEGKMS